MHRDRGYNDPEMSDRDKVKALRSATDAARAAARVNILRQAASRVGHRSSKIAVLAGSICMTTQAEVSYRVVRYEDASIAGTLDHRRLSSRRRRIVGEQAIQHLAFWKLRMPCE